MPNANIPFDRYVRKGEKCPAIVAVGLGHMPRFNPRDHKARGSRRGMGYRGWRRFFIDRSTTGPMATNPAVQARLEQPLSGIRARAAQFTRAAVAKVRGAVGKFFGS